MLNKLAIVTVIGFGFFTPATAEALSLLSHKPLVSPPAIVENVKVKDYYWFCLSHEVWAALQDWPHEFPWAP